MMKLRLIDDWKRAWKFASVQFNVVGIVLMLIEIANQTWQSLPPQLQQNIPHASKIALVFFALGTVGRLFKIKEKPDGSGE